MFKTPHLSLLFWTILVFYPTAAQAQQPDEATLKWFGKAAEYYQNKDYEEAAYWFRKAADQGYAAAQVTLGSMYEEGQGVAKDYKKAVYWYRKAANQGDEDAKTFLGVMYYKGQGVARDYKEAAYWFRKAADQGDEIGQSNLGYMYRNGYGVAKDYEEAIYWYRKAADQGYAVAQFNLGYMYEQGYGVAKDYKKAVYWYRKAADQGDEEAKEALAKLEEENPAPRGNTHTDPYTGMEFIKVQAGTFTMGCTSEQGSNCDDDEKPTHRVTLTQDYYIGKYEVTQAQWRKVMGSNPSYHENCDNCPVEYVSWDDIQEFLVKLNAATGTKGTSKHYRLPTEAEWEYAARGGHKATTATSGTGSTKYAGSNTISDVVWYGDNSNRTHPVGGKAANELGLYDMSGNVYEWCADRYGDYSSSSQTNPKGPSSGQTRVLRGGGWSLNARFCRVSFRISSNPAGGLIYGGFRLCLSL